MRCPSTAVALIGALATAGCNLILPFDHTRRVAGDGAQDAVSGELRAPDARPAEQSIRTDSLTTLLTCTPLGATNKATHSVDHTVVKGTTLLVVQVVVLGATDVTKVTWGSQPLNGAMQVTAGTGPRVEVFTATSPAAGTSTVKLDLAAAANFVFAICNWAGATSVFAPGCLAAPSSKSIGNIKDVPAGQIVVDVVAARTAGGVWPSSGQTVEWMYKGPVFAAGASHATGTGGPVSLYWTTSIITEWAACAFALRP